MKILSAKINRKKFFAGWMLLVIILTIVKVCTKILENPQTEQHAEQFLIAWMVSFIGVILFFCVWMFLFNARCNDIGLSTGEKIGAFVAHLVPLVGLFVFLYLLFKRGKEYEQLLNQEKYRLQIKDNNSKQMETFSKIKGNLLADMKKFWILLFCVVSLATCIFYVPYNMVHPEKNAIIKMAYATIFDIPEKFNPRDCGLSVIKYILGEVECHMN